MKPIEAIQAKLQELFPEWHLNYYQDQDPTKMHFKCVSKHLPAVMRAEKFTRILDLGTYPGGQTIVYLEVTLPLQFCREHGIK